MKKTIAFCGLDCQECDAFKATAADDDELRQRTAKLWSEMNHAPITPEMINCDGCRMNGVKTPYCESLCEIRKCALKRELETCGECPKIHGCPTVGPVLEYSPEARENLKLKN